VASDRRKPVERRLFRIGLILTGVASAIGWVWAGFEAAVSCVAGGALAAISMHWLSRTVSAVVSARPKASRRSVLVGYVLRLMLIPLCLYAMLRLHFLSIPAVVGGFAAFTFAALIEGILEAAGRRPDSDARAE
jgi:ATP synthase I chain